MDFMPYGIILLTGGALFLGILLVIIIYYCCCNQSKDPISDLESGQLSRRTESNSNSRNTNYISSRVAADQVHTSIPILTKKPELSQNFKAVNKPTQRISSTNPPPLQINSKPTSIINSSSRPIQRRIDDRSTFPTNALAGIIFSNFYFFNSKFA
jgi:uncharacterized protein (UPF0333 family)